MWPVQNLECAQMHNLPERSKLMDCAVNRAPKNGRRQWVSHPFNRQGGGNMNVHDEDENILGFLMLVFQYCAVLFAAIAIHPLEARRLHDVILV